MRPKYHANGNLCRCRGGGDPGRAWLIGSAPVDAEQAKEYLARAAGDDPTLHHPNCWHAGFLQVCACNEGCVSPDFVCGCECHAETGGGAAA